MMPYGQTEFLSTINYVRLFGRYQMLNDGDDGVLTCTSRKRCDADDAL